MQPLPLKYVQQQEFFLLLAGRGGFDWYSIQEMPIAERYFFVRELEEMLKKEEEERARQEALSRSKTR